jgi:hypothetical protein
MKRFAGVIAAAFAALAAVGALIRAVFPTSGAAAITVAAVGVIGAVIAAGFAVTAARRERRDRDRELRFAAADHDLEPVRFALAGARIYDLGVEQESPQALTDLDLPADSHAPYLHRPRADRELRDRLGAAAERDEVTLIVLQAPSKAGKTRTLLEAVRAALPDAWFIRPATVQLVALARGGPGRLGSGPCVIWLDDLEPWAGVGDGALNVQTMTLFRRWDRPVILAAAYKGARTSPDTPKDPAAELLRRFPPVDLPAKLTADELEQIPVRSPYARVTSRLRSEGIGELLIVASDIRSFLDSGHPDDRDAVAVADAVIDWRRCGLLRPIPRDALAAIAPQYFNAPSDDQRLRAALQRATRPFYAAVSVVTETQDGYQPYDYAVRVRDDQRQPIPQAAWTLALNLTTDADGIFGVLWAASSHRNHAVAETAARLADERGHPTAALITGTLAEARNDLEAAEAAFRRAAGGEEAAAASVLGVMRLQRGDLDGAEAALRRADDGGDAAAPFYLGAILRQRGDHEGAEAAFRRADDRGFPSGD